MYPAKYVILCVGKKKGKIKIISSSVIKLRFVINVLNNRTIMIILLNLPECPLILADKAVSMKPFNSTISLILACFSVDKY